MTGIMAGIAPDFEGFYCHGAWMKCRGYNTGKTTRTIMPEIPIARLRTVDWRCAPAWRRSAGNTLWCLVGCSIGDFGTIAFFQISGIPWPTPGIMVLAIINGLLTGIALETAILFRGGMDTRFLPHRGGNEHGFHACHGNRHEYGGPGHDRRDRVELVGRIPDADRRVCYPLAIQLLAA